MARLILDTSVLVATERGRSDALDLIDDEDDIAIAAVTAAELLVGLQLADTAHGSWREAFVDNVLETVPIEPYDLDVARAHAALLAHVRREGRPRGAHDLLIAATARAHRRQVATVDRAGFAELPEVGVRSPDSR